MQHHCPFSVTFDLIFFNVLVVLMMQPDVYIMYLCFEVNMASNKLLVYLIYRDLFHHLQHQIG